APSPLRSPLTATRSRRWSGRIRRSRSRGADTGASPTEPSGCRCSCRCQWHTGTPPFAADRRRGRKGDFGEVHLAAITTTQRQALVLSGRRLRARTQGRNRSHAIVQAQLSRSQRGANRWRRLTTRKALVSAQLYRQQLDLLHQTARKAVTFCQAEGVTRIV